MSAPDANGWMPVGQIDRKATDRIAAICWFHDHWGEPVVYQWDDFQEYWANHDRGICIWPQFQDSFRAIALPALPNPPQPTQPEGQTP